MNTMTKAEKPGEIEANRNYLSPLVDIFETKDAYALKADMPGVNKTGLEILLEDNELTIVGRRELPTPAGDVLYRESKPHYYRRVFELDPSIDTGKINAKIEQGLLTLQLPKAEKLKPRKIMVAD